MPVLELNNKNSEELIYKTSSYLPTLDGWRAVAIVAVFVSHGRWTLFGSGGLWENPKLELIASWGRLGVDLFFAISGFLITTRLLSDMDRHGKFSLPQFYVRRVFRIFPPYLIYLGLIAVAGYSGFLQVSPREICDSLLFVRNYTIPPEGVYTNHFWSLAVEEHFYLLWPLLLLFSGKKKAVWIVPAIAVAIHIWRSLDSKFQLFAEVFPDAGLLHRTDTRIDALLWGCEASLMMPLFARLGDRRRKALATPAIFTMLTIGIVCGVPMMPLFIGIVFPLLILSTVLLPATPAGRILEWGALRWIGRLSYSLYIWQTLFLQSPLDSPFFGMPWLRFWPYNLLAIFVLAVISHYLVERPMIRIGHKLTGRLAVKRHTTVSKVVDGNLIGSF